MHVAPHPDDEALGAPATLLQLRDGGADVIDLVASLGRPQDHARRREESVRAAALAGFKLVIPDPPVSISRQDDLLAAQARITTFVADMIEDADIDLVISPSPHDGHHGHEVVGRAVAAAVRASNKRPVWWAWGLWADLPVPTLLVPFDEEVLLEALAVLDCHDGELKRNDYDRLLAARASANAVLGSERVFGFGSGRASQSPYAEVLTELHFVGRSWYFGEPRLLRPVEPLSAAGSRLASDWIESMSVRDRLRLR